ncbi:uncharacterized protein [Epargyreus clarus]|uniref:uncharacterized protein n=1 Tax=Epargyreus clarus TaxID=520877 RepID=UPI003C2DF4A4
MAQGIELAKEEVDKVIEDEITQKLSTDLLQSIERKFQVDLERSVDMVLLKIKLILQNGSHHIQDKLVEIQGMLEVMKRNHENEVIECLTKKENATSMLAERALHQMVVCGYALIGQDPALAVSTVVKLKNMIKAGVKPIYEQKQEIYGLLKVCGHVHDALRKVVQCVISKSPLIKSVMMDVTGKLVEGVVELTKLMAHGAMHEACLIEVVKSVEDDAVELIIDVRNCAYGNESYIKDLDEFMTENNATVLDIINKNPKLKYTANSNGSKGDEMQDILRRMLDKDNTEDLDKRFKENLITLQTDVYGINNNVIGKNGKNKD